jgi:hypothetical protein
MRSAALQHGPRGKPGADYAQGPVRGPLVRHESQPGQARHRHVDQLAGTVRSRLRRIQRYPGLLAGFLAETVSIHGVLTIGVS